MDIITENSNRISCTKKITFGENNLLIPLIRLKVAESLYCRFRSGNFVPDCLDWTHAGVPTLEDQYGDEEAWTVCDRDKRAVGSISRASTCL